MCKAQRSGYAPWMLDRAKFRVDSIPREQFLTEKNRSQENGDKKQMVVFSTPYSTEFKHISGIISRYLPVLDSDPALSDILKGGCKMVAKKAPTVANILASSLVQTDGSVTQTWLHYPGCFKCGHGICICCSVINVSNSFVSATTQQSYKIKQYINCNTSYVVYLVNCSICNEQYVRSTKCPLKNRIRRHLSDVRGFLLSQISYTVRKNIIAAHPLSGN